MLWTSRICESTCSPEARIGEKVLIKDWYFYAFLRNFNFHFYQTVKLWGWNWSQAGKLQYVQKPLKLKNNLAYLWVSQDNFFLSEEYTSKNGLWTHTNRGKRQLYVKEKSGKHFSFYLNVISFSARDFCLFVPDVSFIPANSPFDHE